MESVIELVPCPWCKSTDVGVVRNWPAENGKELFVCCQNCLCSTHNFKPQKGATREAKLAWNRGEVC
jgi:hypothetical protein